MIDRPEATLRWLAPTLLIAFFAAAATTLLGVVVAAHPGEVLYGEGIVLSQSHQLASSGVLYSPFGAPPYTIAAYTPLFYGFVALADRLAGPSLLTGRLLAVTALVAAVVLIGIVVRRQSGWQWGLFASLLFLGQPSVAGWIGLYRVDSLALLLTLGGLALLDRGRLPAGTVLLIAAAFTKQTYLAAPAAAVLALWLQGRRRQAIGVASAIGSAIVVGTAALQWWSGGAYLDHIVVANLNPYYPGLVPLWLIGLWPAGLLLLAGGLAGAIGLSRQWLLWRLYWLISLVNIVALGKDGASVNYLFEPLAASAVLFAGIGDQLGRIRQDRSAAQFLTFAGVVASLVAVPATFERASMLWSRHATEHQGMVQAIERVRSTPGEVLSQDLAVTGLAGKPIAFEYVIFSILTDVQAWQEGRFLTDIATGRYPVLLLIGTDDPLRGTSDWLSPGVWRALQTHYELEAHLGRYSWYRYRASPDDPAS